MNASLIDHLAPEDQIHLAYAAWGVLGLSVVIWTSGVAFARLATAVMLALLGAGTLMFLGAHFGWTFSPITLGIIGSAIGLVIGSLGFGVMQAVTLSLCVGIAVAGLYHRWYLRYSPDDSTPLVTASRPATDLLITIQSPQKGWPGVREAVFHQVEIIPAGHLRHMVVAGFASMVVAMLIALGFPRGTTVALTAFLGAVGIVVCVYCLLHIYRPELGRYMPDRQLWRVVLLILMTALGALIQWSVFVRKTDKPQVKQPPRESTEPAAA